MRVPDRFRGVEVVIVKLAGKLLRGALSRAAAEGGVDEEAEGEHDDDDGGDERPLEANGRVAHLVGERLADGLPPVGHGQHVQRDARSARRVLHGAAAFVFVRVRFDVHGGVVGGEDVGESGGRSGGAAACLGQEADAVRVRVRHQNRCRCDGADSAPGSQISICITVEGLNELRK